MHIPEEQLWHRPCPVCGGEHYVVLRPADYPPDCLDSAELARTYRSSSEKTLMDQLVRCQDCGCQFLSPCLRPEQIKEGYTEAVDPVFVAQNPFRIATFMRVLRRLSGELGLAPGSRILDIGCAGGAFPKAALDLGFKPTGVEPSRWMCDFARREYGVDARYGTLEEQDFQGEPFDMLTFWDVLEHVPHPGKSLELAWTLLKPKGYLVLTYPDISGWPARLLGSHWPFLLSVHLTYYTPLTIRKQLTAAGFGIRSIRPYWQTLSLGYTLSRAAKAAGPFGPLFTGIEKLTRMLRLDSLPCSYYLSQCIVVAEKV